MDKAIGSTVNSPTLQQIFLRYGEAHRQAHKLPYESHKVMNAIEACRTEKLGYHLITCENCGCDYEQKAYNSCRDRHCPQCQSYQSAKWVIDREAELLPVPYFHVTFTIPHELNPLVLWNKEVMYNILFESAWQSLNDLVKDQRYFGGQAGAIAVLHTWGQSLIDHHHVHMIVPGGAFIKHPEQWIQKKLSRDKNGKKKKAFLVHVAPLRILYKTKFLTRLAKEYKKHHLKLSGSLQHLQEPGNFYGLKDSLFKKEWNINIKKPFAGPEEVLKYLGRYTHRVAISNSRIMDIEDGNITFMMKDYRNEGKKIPCHLDAQTFITRFLRHVVPKGFRRIRMFGFLANRFKIRNLEAIRKYLNMMPAKIEKVVKSVHEIIQQFFGVNILKCPKCGMDTLKLKHVPGNYSYTKGYG